MRVLKFQVASRRPVSSDVMRQTLNVAGGPMSEPYVDYECRYLGGDPRLDETGPAEVQLRADFIRVALRGPSDQEAVLLIPKAALQGVRAVAERLGMERAEYEEGVSIGPDEWLTRHTAILDVKDPEGVVRGGLEVRIAFRNEYFCKVFEKRCREAFNLPPF